MKRVFPLIVALFFTASVFAQAPEKMSYQAVVRDASNNLVTNQAVGTQISILQGSVTGTPVYVETQSPTTNTNGLVSLEIGNGTIISGDFTTIDWANGPYFIKTETDPTGGTNYTISGTSQLLSVPYALYAVSSGSSIPGPEGPAGADGAIGATGLQGPAGTDGLGVAQSLSQSGNTITLSDDGGSVSITDNDTQLDAAGVTALGFVSGAHTIDTNTQLDEAAVDGFVANNGYLTTEVDGSITNEIQDLQLTGNNLTITSNGSATTIDLSPYLDNTDNQLSEAEVDAFVANNGYSTTAPVTYSVGDFAQGGIVFWVDETGENGLVCAKSDQSSGIRWYAGTTGHTRARGDGPYAGEANTAIIIAALVAIGDDGATYAARICNELQITEGGKTYGDWYLPSKEELLK